MLPPYRDDEPSRRFRFAAEPLDRRAELRDDDAALARLAADPRARTLVLRGERPLVARGADAVTALFEREAVAGLGGDPAATVFLGFSGAAPWFATVTALDDEALAAQGGIEAADLRALAIAGTLTDAEYGAVAEARAMVLWHASHRFCARCGAASLPASAGWKRVCTVCAAEHFPRTDPVVIMLVERDGKCLLGRSPRFPPGMVSCLAGFMEPGETIEDAVRRETLEEAGITVGRVAYFASEPWPFPMSLMIGVRGEALDAEIRIDEVELEMCRWFDRAEVAQLIAGTHPEGWTAPPSIAIAHHLIRSFLDTIEK